MPSIRHRQARLFSQIDFGRLSDWQLAGLHWQTLKATDHTAYDVVSSIKDRKELVMQLRGCNSSSRP